MRIAACVKQLLDTTVPLRLLNGVVSQEAPWPITRVGAADRAALDEALSLRARLGGIVIAISAGDGDAVDALRFCLARGVDRALHACRSDPFDPVQSATAVAKTLLREGIDLVLCGGRSDDGASGRFPAELADRLDWPLVTAVASLTVERGPWLQVERRVERGDREIVRSPLPVVLAVDGTLAEPRYVSVRARRQASSLFIEEVPFEGGGAGPYELLGLEMPKPRPRRVAGPDARLSAMDRVAHLLSGGLQQKQAGTFVEGTPGTAAAEIVRFLEERGFLRTRKGPSDA